MSMTSRKNPHLGYIVRELRAQAVAGASLAEIMAYLRPRVPDARGLYGWQRASHYLREAFLQDNGIFFLLGPAFSFGQITPEMEDFMGEQIAEHRAEWEGQRYPELLRVRDYVTFLEIARDEHLHITVCDAPPGSSEYRLHGVYDADSGQTAWTARRGEKLRAGMNRRLGRELVRQGPLDDQEQRGAPQLPAISFDPEGGVDHHLRLWDLASAGPYVHNWARLYPDHPVDR
jgi:hypothetical protein